MQFLYQLRRYPGKRGKKLRVLVIEASQTAPRRTWCFWSSEEHTFSSFVSHSWNRVTFAGKSGERSQPVNPYTYQYIDGDHFFKKTWEEAKKDEYTVWLHATVTATKSVGNQTQVETSAGTFTGNKVYSSVSNPAKIESWKRKHGQFPGLWQHFKGWFVRFDESVIAPDAVTLMDFRVPQKDAAVFVYVLPFSPNYALVECTVFGKRLWADEDYDHILKAYIKETFGEKSYRCESVEKGRIPMTTSSFSSFVWDGTEAIGTAGGVVKPSTGYFFLRSERHTKRKVAEYFGEHGSQNIYSGVDSTNSSPPRFAFYDELLLGIIQQEPERVKPIMEALFSKNDFRHIFTFLDERSNLPGDARIFMTLPYIPFLKQLFAYISKKRI